MPEDEIAIQLTDPPVFDFEFEPNKLKTRKEVFLLSDYAQDSLYSAHWIQSIYNLSHHETHIRLADISNPTDFWRHPNAVIQYLEKFPPSILLIQLSPSILHPLLPIPNHYHFSEKDEIPLIQGEPELYKALYQIANHKIDKDSFYSFQPFEYNPYSIDSIPVLPLSLEKKLKAESKKVQKSLQKIANTCQKYGIRLVFIPQPILWKQQGTDRYSRVPIDKLLLWNDKPAAWYGAAYYLMLNILQKELSKKGHWIDAYKVFPTDSRFYSDGFRLNWEGQTFFAQQFAGRVGIIKSYRSVF